jgi:hypothetical protein
MGKFFEAIAPAFLILLLMFIGGFALYLLAGHRRRKKLSSIVNGESEVLLKWKYSPEDWKSYAENPASRWIGNGDLPGEAFITPENILVTNGEDRYFYEFAKKKITQCAFFHPFLDLRIEWMGGTKAIPVQLREDFRLFVPNAHKEEISDLVEEFKVMTKSNARFALNFYEDDEMISLFENK